MNPAFRLACVSGLTASLAAVAAAQLAGPEAPAKAEPAAVAPAEAKRPADPARDLAALIVQLGDPSAAVRDEAERKLSALPLTQDQLERAIQDPDATPEQRVRLERLGPRVLFQTSRAAMGVSFSQTDLEISQCHEGFDSQRVLKAGDQIVGIGTHPVFTMRELRPAIIMHPPGTEVPVRVVREGRITTVKLTLGDFGRLPRSPWRDSVTFEDCTRAWDLRTSDLREARRRDGRHTTLTPGLTAEAWDRATRTDPAAKRDLPSWGDGTLVAAGQPRAAGEDLRGPRARLTGLPDERREQRLLRQMEDLRRLGDLQRKLAADGLDAAARAKVQAEIDEVMTRVFEGMDILPGEQRIP